MQNRNDSNNNFIGVKEGLLVLLKLIFARTAFVMLSLHAIVAQSLCKSVRISGKSEKENKVNRDAFTCRHNLHDIGCFLRARDFQD
jgi:hypothetical protein